MEKAKTAEETLYTYHPIKHDLELRTDLWPTSTIVDAMKEYGQICAEQARREENEKYHLERIKRIQAELKLREASDLLKKLKEASGIMDYDLIAQISKYLSGLAAAGYEGKEGE